MAKKERAPDPRSEKTREALLKATISLGAQFGFDNVSVRQIARAAGENIGSITYHFGTKEKLRLAVIDHIGRHMRTYGPGQKLRELAESGFPNVTKETAAIVLKEILLIAIKANNMDSETKFYPIYIQREIFQSGANVEYFYEKVFSTELELMCQLVARLSGGAPEAPETRIKALTLIAQSVFMSLASHLVQRAMDWETYDQHALDNIGDAFWLKP